MKHELEITEQQVNTLVPNFKFRNLRKHLEPSQAEMKIIINEFKKIENKKFDNVFIDRIKNFIGIMREKYIYTETILKKAEKITQLDDLKKSLVHTNEALQALDDRIVVNMLSFMQVDDRFEPSDNHILTIEHYNKKLIEACSVTISEIEEHPKQMVSFKDMRGKMATELARELHAYNVKIKAYDGGAFEKYLRVFFRSFNNKEQGFAINAESDLMPFLRIAKDNYKNPNRYPFDC